MNGLDLRALFSLDGKIALVTGGSRGIGYMISQGLLQAGARVYITARDADACRGAAGELGRRPHLHRRGQERPGLCAPG